MRARTRRYRSERCRSRRLPPPNPMLVVARSSQPPTTHRDRQLAAGKNSFRLAYWGATARPVCVDVAIRRPDRSGDLMLAQPGLARCRAERVERFAGRVAGLGHAARGLEQPEVAFALCPASQLRGVPGVIQRPASRRL